MDGIYFYGILAVVWVATVGLSALVPYLSRRPVSFGVALPPERYGDEEVRRQRLRYMGQAVLAGLLLGIAAGVLSALGDQDAAALWHAALLLVYAAVTLLLFLQGRSRLKRLKEERGWTVPSARYVAVDTAFHLQRSTPGWGWSVLPLLVVAASAATAAWFYPAIPDVLNVHYNGAGEVDRTAPKSIGLVFTPSLIALLVTGLLAAAAGAVTRSKQELNPSDPEGSRERSLAFRRMGALFLLLLAVPINLLFGLIQFGLAGLLGARVVEAGAIGLILLILAVSILYAVRMSKLNLRESGFLLKDDDIHWKGGLFYYNPDDAAVLVEKRVGLGWTLNYAHTISWLLTLAPFLLTAIIVAAAVLAGG